MRYVFHPEAEIEFFAAIDYYEGRESGLGYDFAIEVHSTINTILRFPHTWAIIEDDIRRCQTRRFPYWHYLCDPRRNHFHSRCYAPS